MKIVFLGDIHGNIDKAIDFLKENHSNADYVIQVGDFGIWPDPNRVDRATRKHGGAGDFPKYWQGKKILPFFFVFCHGNHEDFDFLNKYKNTHYIIDNLYYAASGSVHNIGGLRIAFLGGNYSYKAKKPRHIKPWIAQNLKAEEFDILVTHDCARGTPLKTFAPLQRGKDGNVIMPGSPHILELIETVRPKFHFFGHYHQKADIEIGDTRSICLNSVPYKDCAFELLI